MEQVLQQIQNKVMVPLYGPENRRPGEWNPGGQPHIWEQRYVNCYPEFALNPGNPNAPADVSIIKRPGIQPGTALSPTIASYGTIANMTCLVNMSMTGLTDVYVSAWFDATNNKIYIIQYRPVAGTTTKIGEITSAASSNYVFITEIVQNVGGTYPAGTLTPAIAVTWMKADRTAGAGYYATSSGGVFTSSSLNSIASGSFPSNLGTPKVITGPIKQMNGVNYIMTIEGTIYASGGTGGTLYDITSWNTNAIVAASMYPDLGVAVERYKNYILAVGQSSIEFFQDSAVPPPNSPLTRVEQATIKIGCASPTLMLNLDDTFYWVAYSADATLGVWTLNGYTPQKISPPYVDYSLATTFSSGTSNANILTMLQLHFKKHLMITGPISQILGGTLSTINALNLHTATSGDTVQLGSSINPNVLMWSIEDKVWWWMDIGQNIYQPGFALPAVAQSFTTNTAWKQWCFLSEFGDGVVYSFQNFGGGGTYIDFTTDPTTGLIVYAYVQFNTLWWGTESKKRVNKIKVVSDMLTRNSTDTQTYSVVIGWAKQTLSDTSVSTPSTGSGTRRIPLTATTEVVPRYYASNIGTCRSLAIYVAQNHPSSWRIRGVELELDQLTR